MSAIVDHTRRIDDPTAAIEVPPRGVDLRETAGPPLLARGRWLVCGDQAYGLSRDVTHVGRGLAADVRLDDHTVSARHAIVVLRSEGPRILDDRSTNGTVVNGRRVDEAELHDGDVVVLGRVVLTYRDVR